MDILGPPDPANTGRECCARFWTPEETCRILRISRRSLDRMLSDGTLKYIKLGSGKSAPVRILNPEAQLGLTSQNKERRRTRQADAEYHRAMSRMKRGKE